MSSGGVSSRSVQKYGFKSLIIVQSTNVKRPLRSTLCVLCIMYYVDESKTNLEESQIESDDQEFCMFSLLHSTSTGI